MFIKSNMEDCLSDVISDGVNKSVENVHGCCMVVVNSGKAGSKKKEKTQKILKGDLMFLSGHTPNSVTSSVHQKFHFHEQLQQKNKKKIQEKKTKKNKIIFT
ncbi:MAG: hypothetical protein ACRC2N_06105 [Aeromonas sp.]